MNIHWNILDEKRLAILPLLKEMVGDEFYLAGGTGLALQFGHRDSIDFDFFTGKDFDTMKLIDKLETVFSSHTLAITQTEKNTVSCLVDSTIQLSFITYRYPLQKPLVATEYFDIASPHDIGGMKLSAITSRSVEKDYIDLYFILQSISLSDLLAVSTEMHPTLDASLILKSLVYFDDVQEELIIFKENHEVSFDTIQKFIETTVRQYFAQ